MLVLICVIVGVNEDPFTIHIDGRRPVTALKNAIREVMDDAIVCKAPELKLYFATKNG